MSDFRCDLFTEETGVKSITELLQNKQIVYLFSNKLSSWPIKGKWHFWRGLRIVIIQIHICYKK